MDPATRSIPTVSSGMIGRAALPGCIIATTAISVTVTTGKEGGIDPEPWPANWLIPFDLTSLTARLHCDLCEEFCRHGCDVGSQAADTHQILFREPASVSSN
jgi:hypothetical protein